MAGFGIDTQMAHDAGDQMVKAFTGEEGNSIYQIWDDSYYSLPPEAYEAQGQFRSNFFKAYQDLIQQHKSIGNALMNAATTAEMDDLKVAQGFHTSNGLLPQQTTAPAYLFMLLHGWHFWISNQRLFVFVLQ